MVVRVLPDAGGQSVALESLLGPMNFSVPRFLCLYIGDDDSQYPGDWIH